MSFKPKSILFSANSNSPRSGELGCPAVKLRLLHKFAPDLPLFAPLPQARLGPN